MRPGVGGGVRCGHRSGSAGARTAPRRCSAQPARRASVRPSPGRSRAAARVRCGAVVVPAQQHAGAVVLEHQDGGQQRASSMRRQRQALQAREHARAGGGAFGQVRAQPAVAPAATPADSDARVAAWPCSRHTSTRQSSSGSGWIRSSRRRTVFAPRGDVARGRRGLRRWWARACCSQECGIRRYRRNARRIDPDADRRSSA